MKRSRDEMAAITESRELIVHSEIARLPRLRFIALFVSGVWFQPQANIVFSGYSFRSQCCLIFRAALLNRLSFVSSGIG